MSTRWLRNPDEFENSVKMILDCPIKKHMKSGPTPKNDNTVGDSDVYLPINSWQFHNSEGFQCKK